jgi:molybdopterin-guanine dinucleotide biosynthesis protein A
MNFDAVILAGGKSSRMNRDKAFLNIDGTPLLARQIELVRLAGATKVFISGRSGTDYSGFGCPVLEDKFEDAGPLAGIERALEASTAPLLLVVAVDLPNLTSDFLGTLARHCRENAGAIPRINGKIEPLVAFYPKAAHPLLLKFLGEKSNAVKDFALGCASSGLATIIDLPADHAKLFDNWNSPEDLRFTTG